MDNKKERKVMEKEKKDEGQVEGRNAVLELLESGKDINKIFITKGEKHGSIHKIIAIAKERRIILVEKDKKQMEQMAQTPNYQGVIATVPPFAYCDVEDILEEAKQRQEDPFILILDGIEDPHNFGAIIRSCECAGVHGIIIGKNRCAKVNETVIKTSTGAISNMPIARVSNIKDAIEELKKHDIWVYGAEIGGENIYCQKLDRNIAVVIGSEGSGIRPVVKSRCDGIITLPLKGKVNSLNASVACGIVIFEILRQREG